MASEKNWVDPASYEFVKPSDNQDVKLLAVRNAARSFADVMEKVLPSGPDRAHAFRQFRTAVMWTNYIISRSQDDIKDDEPEKLP